MPLNKTHENILDGTFKFIFDDIRESAPPDVAVAAHQAIFDDDVYIKMKPEFDRFGITVSVDQARKVLKHPQPQNRSKSSADFYQLFTPGSVVYSIRRGDIKSEDKETIILKDGTSVARSLVIAEYKKSEPEQSEETAYVASEPEGLLSLTSRGPVTREEMVSFIHTRSELEAKEIQKNSPKLFSELKHAVVYLHEGLMGDITSVNRNDVEQSLNKLQEYAKSDPVLAKAILLRINQIFHERSDFYRKDGETDTSYIDRVVPLVSGEVRLNLDKYDREFKADEQTLASISAKLKEITTKIQDLKSELETLKAQIKKQFWGETLNAKKLLNSEFDAQWNALISSDANLTRTNKSFQKFLPDEAVIERIKAYKKLFDEITTLENLAQGYQVEKFKIEERRKSMLNKRAVGAQQREWLNYLRHGDFRNAARIWLPSRHIINLSDSKQKNMVGEIKAVFTTLDDKSPILDINVKDEFGKSAIYYALKYGNYLLARELAVSYEADVSNIVFFGRSDIIFALNPTPGTSRYTAWRTVIENEIRQDLRNLAAGTIVENMRDLRNKYTDYAIEFSETFNEFMSKIEKDFYWFLRGAIVGNLEKFKTLFLLFDKGAKFEQLYVNALADAEEFLKQYLEGASYIDLSQIKFKFERLGKTDRFRSLISDHLILLDRELEKYLNKHGNPTEGLQAIMSRYERVEARDKFNFIIGLYKKEPPQPTITLSPTMMFENLKKFIDDLLAVLKALPHYRKNLLGTLFKSNAKNKSDKELFEQQLESDKSRLTTSNVNEIANLLSQQICSYRRTLVRSEGEKIGQSRYLASLDKFLDSKNLPRISFLTDEQILQATDQKASGLEQKTLKAY